MKLLTEFQIGTENAGSNRSWIRNYIHSIIRIHSCPHRVLLLSGSFNVLPGDRPILTMPQLLRRAPHRRRIQPINHPQPPLRLIDMELPIIALVRNMRLQNAVDTLRHSFVRGILVWLMHRNVFDRDTDEWRLVLAQFAADVDVVHGELDELYDDVELWEFGAVSAVPCGDIFRECFLGLVVLECARWVKD